MMKCDGQNQTGFTLIELMIAMVISSIVMAAVYSFFISSNKMSIVQNASVAAEQSVRTGLEIMVQDIRMAGYDPLKTSGAAISINQSSKIQITSDRNGDGDIDDSDFEKVTYELSGGNLRRILYEGSGSQNTQSIIENVTDLIFTYSGSGNCNVNIELQVTETVAGGNSVIRRLETRVYCRNLDF